MTSIRVTDRFRYLRRGTRSACACPTPLATCLSRRWNVEVAASFHLLFYFQIGLFRRSRFNDVIYAASFVERSGHKLRWRLGGQAPEETAVALSGRSTFADWLCEIELDIAAGLDR